MASGASCMLFMMHHTRSTLCLSALPCSVCGIGTPPCSVLLQHHASVHVAAAGVRLWGWLTTPWNILLCLVPLMMLLMMHYPHRHQLSGWIGVVHPFFQLHHLHTLAAGM